MLTLLMVLALPGGTQRLQADDLPLPSSGLPAREIVPADVLSQVRLFRDELERIRFEMGKPLLARLEIPVTNASPREVYFQALTLYGKADRLAQNLTLTEGERMASPRADTIRPRHVNAVIIAAIARLRVVKARLGIRETSVPVEMPAGTQPTDVFRSIVQANRQLNLMLDTGVAPSEVFQQVAYAIEYTDCLLETFPSTTSASEKQEPPPFVRGKRPKDVYRRLFGCLDSIEKLTTASGLEMLRIEQTEEQFLATTPSDVFDMASLILSEISFLHALRPKARPPREIYFPGRRFPSHVFQEASRLDARLKQLRQLVEDNPTWLNEESSQGE